MTYSFLVIFCSSAPHSGRDTTCITYAAIDTAFIAARDRYGLPRPGKKMSAVELGNLGTVLTEATKIIAKQ